MVLPQNTRLVVARLVSVQIASEHDSDTESVISGCETPVSHQSPPQSPIHSEPYWSDSE